MDNYTVRDDFSSGFGDCDGRERIRQVKLGVVGYIEESKMKKRVEWDEQVCVRKEKGIYDVGAREEVKNKYKRETN